MLSVTEKKVSDLIDLAYESALDPKEDGWKLFYEQFAKLVSGRGGCLAVYDKADSSFREIARIHDPAIEEELNSTYYSLIPWRAELESLIPGEAFIRRRDFPDHIFVSSDIYRAFFERHGVFQFKRSTTMRSSRSRSDLHGRWNTPTLTGTQKQHWNRSFRTCGGQRTYI